MAAVENFLFTFKFGRHKAEFRKYEFFKPDYESIHVRRYSPFSALASLTRRLHSPLSTARLLHPLIPRICNASLWSMSSLLFLGLHIMNVRNKFCDRQ